MSKKKPQTRATKLKKRHDFSHLVKTKAAAKVVEIEAEVNKETVNPLNKQIARDLRVGLIVIGAFVILTVAVWFFFGRNGELVKLTDNIKFY